MLNMNQPRWEIPTAFFRNSYVLFTCIKRLQYLTLTRSPTGSKKLFSQDAIFIQFQTAVSPILNIGIAVQPRNE